VRVVKVVRGQPPPQDDTDTLRHWAERQRAVQREARLDRLTTALERLVTVLERQAP
jgi:hypothetical protein